MWFQSLNCRPFNAATAKLRELKLAKFISLLTTLLSSALLLTVWFFFLAVVRFLTNGGGTYQITNSAVTEDTLMS